MADGLKISTLVLVLLRVSIEAVHVYYDCVWHKLLLYKESPKHYSRLARRPREPGTRGRHSTCGAY